jgi:hypothetical protein
MPVKLLLIAFIGLLTAASPSRASFQGTISTVSRAELRYSYRPGCPVAPAALRRLDLSYWGFDRKPHVGSIVVHASEARNVVSVFRRLYAARFQIRRLRLVEAYKGSDDASMAADNTSGFNCRRVYPGGPWSAHAYGLAIDLNPVENPYVHGGLVEPRGGRRYLDRANRRRGMIVSGDAVVRAFTAIGWPWGGQWSSSKDYQHFSATGR